MTLTIDHVVIGVRDLEEAVAEYLTAGFNVIPGGRHADGFTHNALIVFQDGAYLELLAPTSPALLMDASMSGKGFLSLLKDSEGLVTFALQSDDLAVDMADLQARGLATRMTPAAGRVRPDGIALRWQTAWLVEGAQPFFIQDITPRNLRVPDQADVCAHPNRALGLAGLTVAVGDLTATGEKYRRITGQDAGGGVRFDVGGIEIELVEQPGMTQTEQLIAVVLKGQRSVRLPMEWMQFQAMP